MTQASPQEATKPLDFEQLRSINVSNYIEKKGNLSYLSWAYAVDQLLLKDTSATWEYRFGKEMIGNDETSIEVEVPYVRIGATAMVFCTVRAFGVERTAQLPVMDNRNKPISHPDAFQVNTAMQRCLAKAIALHGIGLYIYAGEDLPEEPPQPEVKLTVEQIAKAKESLNEAKTLEDLRDTYNKFDAVTQEVTKEYALALKKKFEAKKKASDE
jgi:hypothetical protein